MIRCTFTIEQRRVTDRAGPIQFKVGIHKLQIFGLTIWKWEEFL